MGPVFASLFTALFAGLQRVRFLNFPSSAFKQWNLQVYYSHTSRSAVSFRVLSRTNIACTPHHSSPKSQGFKGLPPLCVSLPSFPHPGPLFSTTCSLFFQNTRGWGYPAELPFRISGFRPLFCPYVDSALGACPEPVGASRRYQLPSILLALCFHNDTNPFSRNSVLFTSMQIPRGCGGA